MNEEGRENFKFFFKGGNKTVSISVGDSQDLNIQEILEAVKDIIVAGGFTYVDDIRAVNFGEKYNMREVVGLGFGLLSIYSLMSGATPFFEKPAKSCK